MFDWLFRRFRKLHADHPSDAPAGSNTGGTGDPNEALSKVVWIEPEGNPFNMRVLDCRPFTTTMMSVTSDREVAETIGIIKFSIGGTSVLTWKPDWSKEKADRVGQGRHGSLYKKLIEGRYPAAQWTLKSQFDAQKAIPNSKMVILRDIEKHPQNVHCNTAGQLVVGKLFAAAYLER